MSAKMTLEEIRGEHTRVRLLSEEDEAEFVAKNFPRLLEIAQEQAAEIAAMRPVIELSRVCANENPDSPNGCSRTDDHHIALMDMDMVIKAIGTKK